VTTDPDEFTSMKNTTSDCIHTLNSAARVLILALLPLACATGEEGYTVGDKARLLETQEHRVSVTVIVDDLKYPWSIAELPDGSLLITEKQGLLHHVDPEGGRHRLVEGLPESAKHGQGGLMDVRPHPDFADNRWVYLTYSIASGEGYATRAARGRLENGRLEDIEVLFTAEPLRKSGRHFGSALAFDDDGHLYITSGERGSRPLIQDLSNHIGKIVRLHEDGSVPHDNPFVGIDGALPEIYSYGHRNPQGIAIEPGTGVVWSVEHGPRGGDELNRIEAGSNYGWPVITYGEEYRGGQIGEGTHKEGMEQPVHYYVPSIATSGLAFYDGEAFPRWRGNAFIGALVQTHVNRLVLERGRVVHEERLLDDWNLRIRDIEPAADGSLYVLADKGPLLKLSPADR
jgi:glucose/arabinose dehydrogenase